jgi:hypothetical protein
MLIRTCALIGIFTLALSASAREPTKSLGDQLTQAWTKSRSVQFYFVSRTEKYTLTQEALKKAATIKVYRACGNNCASFMAPVTAHLKAARTVQCQAGQENVLIEPSSGPSLLFSNAGRVLRVGSSCYLVPASIDAVLKKEGFFFH